MTGGKPKRRVALQRLRPVLDELDDISWRVEQGSKHLKLFIGEEMALVLPHGPVSDADNHLWRHNIKNVQRAAERQRSRQAASLVSSRRP